MPNSHRLDLLEILKKQIQEKRISHSYLVFGDFSEEIIAELFKISRADLLILAENPIKIQHIRELIHWINLKPHSSPAKLAIISGIENLTLEAANSLLKILEEPPPKSIIILKAVKDERILPTIISRCQVIRQKNFQPTALIDDYLAPQDLAKKSLQERFSYVNKIVESENFLTILNLWEEDFRRRLGAGEDVLGILKQIFHVRSLLSTNISLKLQLENLIIKI